MRHAEKPRPLAEYLATFLVFGFAVFVLFYNLGGRYIEDWDEGIYIRVSQRALETGDCLVMQFENHLLWDKTPFPLWPMIFSSKLFGFNETSARLSSALFGLGILMQIFLIARRFYGPATALLSVLVAITTTQFVFHHGLKTANIDSITIFFLLGAISSWVLIETERPRLVLTAASLACAFLCKGPLIGIPVVVILLSAIPRGKRPSITPKNLVLSVLLFIAIIAPWYLYMYVRFGDEFLERHVVRVFFLWFAKGVDSHVHDDLHLIKTTLLSPHYFPWFGAAIISVVYFFKLYSEEKRQIDFILIAWVLITLLVVNGSRTKLYWYVFPLYPMLAVMIAKTLSDFVRSSNYLNKAAFYLGLLIVLTHYFDQRLFPGSAGFNFAKAGLAVLGIFSLATLCARYVPRRQGVVNAILVCFLCYFPLKETYNQTLVKNLDAPILALANRLEPGQRINTFQLYRPAASYYLSRRFDLREFYGIEDVEQLRGGLVVVRSELEKKLPPKDDRGGFTVEIGGNSYRVTPLMTENEFTLFKVD
ncbi:MAG: ArnT family glycosyltransferase [Chloroflexota bacterium]